MPGKWQANSTAKCRVRLEQQIKLRVPKRQSDKGRRPILERWRGRGRRRRREREGGRERGSWQTNVVLIMKRD